MNNDRMKDVLDKIAHRAVSEEINLWPNISIQFERKPALMTLRTRPLMAILIVLLILLVLSSAVYALGRAFGYNPGIGVVEQSSSMRMLEAPAPLEREGIRVTVTNVIASSASTSIRFQVEWLNSSTMGKFDTGCQGMPALILSDGRQLNFVRTVDKFTVGEPGSNVG